MEKISLYQISESLSKLEEMAENDDMLAPYLESVSLQFENKVDQIVKYRQNLTADCEMIDVEVQRLLAMKKSREKLAERLKDYVSQAMLAHNMEKLDTGLFRISFRSSESISVVDENLIPEEYILIKTVKQVDKLSLKKAIKSGQTIPGVELKEAKNIQIK